MRVGKTIFATHYHEINQMSKTHPNVACLQVLVSDMNGQISFDYKIGAGGASKSYGIHIAALASESD